MLVSELIMDTQEEKFEFELLIADIFIEITHYLSLKDILNLLLISKKVRVLASSQDIYRITCSLFEQLREIRSNTVIYESIPPIVLEGVRSPKLKAHPLLLWLLHTLPLSLKLAEADLFDSAHLILTNEYFILNDLRSLSHPKVDALLNPLSKLFQELKNISMEKTREQKKQSAILLFNIAITITLAHLQEANFDNLTMKIEELEILTVLKSNNNSISQLPKEIGYLINLTHLDLSFNQIRLLPEKIGNLTNLKFLNLSHNLIELIPKEIAELRKLKRLDLSNNKITNLPNETEQLEALEELNLANNPLNYLPLALVKKFGNQWALKSLNGPQYLLIKGVDMIINLFNSSSTTNSIHGSNNSTKNCKRTRDEFESDDENQTYKKFR